MYINLAKKLVEKGAIRVNTEIEAHFHGHSLSCLDNARLIGQFRIKSAALSKDKNKVVFEALSQDNKTYRFSNDEVVTLDGMPPARLAAIYDLSLEGDDLVVGKRRGRKPRKSDA